MKLIFIRHAIAEGKHHPDQMKDFMRPLIKRGRDDFKPMVKLLKKHYPEINHLYTSASLRAVETAELIYKKIQVGSFELLPELDLFSSPQELLQFISGLSDEGSYAFVGHEPHLSHVISILIKHQLIKLEKGAFCCLRTVHSEGFALECLIAPAKS